MEDCETIDLILRKKNLGESLTDKEKAKLDRVMKPLSERELNKWGDKEWTKWQLNQVCLQRYACELFENLVVD